MLLENKRRRLFGVRHHAEHERSVGTVGLFSGGISCQLEDVYVGGVVAQRGADDLQVGPNLRCSP